ALVVSEPAAPNPIRGSEDLSAQCAARQSGQAEYVARPRGALPYAGSTRRGVRISSADTTYHASLERQVSVARAGTKAPARAPVATAEARVHGTRERVARRTGRGDVPGRGVADQLVRQHGLRSGDRAQTLRRKSSGCCQSRLRAVGIVDARAVAPE